MPSKREHLRTLMLHEFRLGRSATQALHNLRTTMGATSVSYKTVLVWFKKFKTGDEDLGDRPRPKPASNLDDGRLLALIEEDPPGAPGNWDNFWGWTVPRWFGTCTRWGRPGGRAGGQAGKINKLIKSSDSGIKFLVVYTDKSLSTLFADQVASHTSIFSQITTQAGPSDFTARLTCLFQPHEGRLHLGGRQHGHAVLRAVHVLERQPHLVLAALQHGRLHAQLRSGRGLKQGNG